MTQFEPPMPPLAPMPGYQPYEPRPYSTTAIIGFIASLLVCCPVIAPAVGLILGLVGMAKTAGGRARGRGLAIAALIISLLVMLGQAGYGYYGYRVYASIIALRPAGEGLLKASDAEMKAAVESFRAAASDSFRSHVSEDALTRWASHIRREYGRLQDITISQQNWMTPRGSDTLFHLKGSFVNKPGDVDVTVRIIGTQTFFEDIAVGGASPKDKQFQSPEDEQPGPS